MTLVPPDKTIQNPDSHGKSVNSPEPKPGGQRNLDKEERSKALEQVADFINENLQKIRPADLKIILRYVAISTWLSVIAAQIFIVGTTISLTKATNKWWPERKVVGDPGVPAELQSLGISEFLSPLDVQSRFPELLPTVKYLEDEADAEVSSLAFPEVSVVGILSVPLQGSTKPFILSTRIEGADQVTGYGYALSNMASQTRVELLNAKRVGASSLEVKCRSTGKSDRVLLILKVSRESGVWPALSGFQEITNFRVTSYE